MLDFTNSCPVCGEQIVAVRNTKKYCSPKCRKKFNQENSDRTVKSSPSQKRRHIEEKSHYGEMTINFYATPPAYRVEFLERLTVEGKRLRETTRFLLRYVEYWGYLARGMLPIQQVLNHYCQEVYSKSLKEVLDENYVLPDRESVYFPCEFYGPDRDSVYSDGKLRLRGDDEFLSKRGRITEKLSTGKEYDPKFIMKSLGQDRLSDFTYI